MEHRPSGTKVDLHHRIVPTSIYGFQVSDPDVPWSSSNGVMSGTAKDIDVRFHVAHMIIHIFHHLFYNLRLMHLFDLKLALAAWQLQAAEVIEMASGFMPRRIVVDILSLVDALFAGAPGLPHDLDSNTVNGFVRNGSIPLLYPLRRVDHPSELTAVVAAEISRGWFVLRFMPGRFGRPTAPLHPSR